MPSVIVHGGAARIARKDISGHEAACRRAVLRGLETLAAGGSALDAAVAAVIVLEDDPITNAGTGSVLNEDGEVEMDALAMEGTYLSLGAVAAIRDVRNPILVARALLDESDVNILAHDGASRYAASRKIGLIDPKLLITEAALRRHRERGGGPGDTVGAAVCDDLGHTAAAISTGGTPNKRRGRIGDTPIVGSGAYADDDIGAAVATGVGEGIMRVLLARTALEFLAQGLDVSSAARAAIEVLEKRVSGEGGVILVDRAGNCGFAFNTPQMSHAHGRDPDSVRVGH